VSSKVIGLIPTFLALTGALVAEKIPGRYIVEFTAEPVCEHVARSAVRAGLRSGVATAHRARVRAEQQQARGGLEQRQARILDGIDTIGNALLVQVPEEAAGELASLPGVKRVLPVRRLRRLLDRAVILDAVTSAWNQVGTDRAGAGVKIAILDSGIDSSHPGLQDASLAAPDTFPRANATSDLAFTNGKIIVARSYVRLLGRDPDWSARDRDGHGTALAMIAAGVRNAGPLATITGVAPRAYLGNYKVFGTPGFNDETSDDVLLKAMDDAVADGMDILSLSLGSDLAPRLSDDPLVQAVELAAKAGVMVVAAAGNNGPDPNTMCSPATAPAAIAVGASTNDRTFAGSLEAPGLPKMVAVLGDGPAPSAPITALLADVGALDGSGLACSALPASGLQGRIALIARGRCHFETKLNHAQAAGAVAALVLATADSPRPTGIAVGSATLPAAMIGYYDGLAIRQSLASQPSLAATLRFTLGVVSILPGRLTDFSGAGPNVDDGIKPDLAAVGSDIYVATQTFDPSGSMYDPSGYLSVSGTSFATPIVAGAAALLKSARPGLSVEHYRSLLIHTAGTLYPAGSAVPLPRARSQPGLSVQQSGAGMLDVGAALRSTVAAHPIALSLGSGGPDPQRSQVLTITNVGASTERYYITVAPRTAGLAPLLGASMVQLGAGASIAVPVSWVGAGLPLGTYEGFVTIAGTTSGAQARIPYWYAVPSPFPAHITILDRLEGARRGSAQQNAILFRVTEASGLALTDPPPEVTALSGGGGILSLNAYDREVPGLWGIDVQMGTAPGVNVFRIQAGTVVKDVAITGW
jgi:subtilisin family serine protease